MGETYIGKTYFEETYLWKPIWGKPIWENLYREIPSGKFHKEKSIYLEKRIWGNLSEKNLSVEIRERHKRNLSGETSLEKPYLRETYYRKNLSVELY